MGHTGLARLCLARWYYRTRTKPAEVREAPYRWGGCHGIRVTMYYEDHNPPHFHAEYNGNKAIVDINEVRVIKGALPSRQLKLILAWCVIHQDELMQNWELSKDGLPLNRINPLV